MNAGAEPGGSCPRCGAAYDAGQEYCLECGRRLPIPGEVGSSLGAAWERRVGGRRPGSWIWPVLVGLLIAAAMTGVSIAIARGSDGGDDVLVATSATTFTTTTETLTETEPTTTAETETAPTEPEPPPTTTRRPELVDWPPSQSGYTIVIASIPTGSGRADAVRKAREVLRSGLPEVGVIDSAEFSSLHPGYYVVFSGIYSQQREALRAAPRVQGLYPAAYIRQISR